MRHWQTRLSGWQWGLVLLVVGSASAGISIEGGAEGGIDSVFSLAKYLTPAGRLAAVLRAIRWSNREASHTSLTGSNIEKWTG